jgi:IstB-like ATP binding protein
LADRQQLHGALAEVADPSADPDRWAWHRVLFATAAEWVARLADAHHAGRLHGELRKLGRYPLLIIDEVGYIPFQPEAANLFFQLVSARYERASLIVTSNKPFGRGVRRRRGRRRDDRPPRPSRRGHQPEGRQLQNQRQEPGPHPRPGNRGGTSGRGSEFNCRQRFKVSLPLTMSRPASTKGLAKRSLPGTIASRAGCSHAGAASPGHHGDPRSAMSQRRMRVLAVARWT